MELLSELGKNDEMKMKNNIFDQYKETSNHKDLS